MSVRLMYYDNHTGESFYNGFGENAKFIVSFCFSSDPDLQDQTVLSECDKTKEFWYTRIDEHIVYQSTLEKLKGEL